MAVYLGDEVRDEVTGFHGVAIARTEWLHGCVRITVQPKVDKNGKFIEPVTFDEPQLIVLKKVKAGESTEMRVYGERTEPKQKENPRKE